MATIAIGDIHGNVAALTNLLTRIRDDVGANDTVVFLGDYIDRGPDSRGCVDAILNFRRDIRADVVCLRGNHEDWLLRTQADYSRHSWLFGMDAIDTVRSYSLEAATALRGARSDLGLRLYTGRCELPYHVFFDAMPASHRSFFSELSLCYESPDCLCSHAGVDPAVQGLAGQPPKALVWGHPSFPAEYAGEPPIVYGHFNNAEIGADGWPIPKVIGNTICADTIFHGVLSAVRMPDRQVIQSNGQETRSIAL